VNNATRYRWDARNHEAEFVEIQLHGALSGVVRALRPSSSALPASNRDRDAIGQSDAVHDAAGQKQVHLQI
jgi:hypothetical protein